jgi:hypothetical protein
MRWGLKSGDRITLSECRVRGVKKTERTGTVVGASQTGTRYCEMR